MSVRSNLIVQFIATVAATGVIFGIAALPAAIGAHEALGIGQDLLDFGDLPENEPPIQNSYILAADGSEIAEISFEERRVPVDLDDVPQVMIDAVIATEDNTFWEHNGVNHGAIVSAAIDNATAGSIQRGASTITQQYIKNAYLTSEQSINRKVKEAIWAVELEQRESKRWILEAYLNRLYLGNGVYGIGTAANYYFGKSVDEIGLQEAAVLAGMIRSPIGNDPTRNPVASQARRDIVITQMAREGFISAETAQAAMDVDVRALLDVTEPPPPTEPHWVDWITRLLVDEGAARGLGTQTDAFAIMGETPEDRIATVFQGGLRIRTTLDPQMQGYATDAVKEFLPDAATDPMGGIVTVEPGTGAIRAMAVGPKEFGECTPGEAGVDSAGRMLCTKSKFNPLIPADAGSSRVGRQPGSSFKPYVIAAALEAGIPPGWEVEASGPQTIPGCDNGGPWTVNNSGGNGIRNMYTGVAGSSNVFHARLIKEVGPLAVADMAERAGIRRSDLSDAPCSLALGAREVFPLEQASGYATFANLGEYCAPYAIEFIEDAQGRPLYQHQRDCEQVMDESVARRVVDIMKGPVQGGGTAPIANLGAYATRGKTGTTNDYVDAWFVGYIRQYATAAWIGYENGSTTFVTPNQARAACKLPATAELSTPPRCAERRLMTGVTIGGQAYRRIFGGTIPAPMWKAYMSRVIENLEPESFPSPGGIPGATVPDITNVASVEEARQIASAARLNFRVEEVVDYRPAGTIIGQTPGAGAVVNAGASVALLVSDGTGPSPAVPEVVGLTQDVAVTRLTDALYTVEITTAPIGSERFHGIVIAQSPLAGEIFPDGEPVTVNITIGVPPDPGAEISSPDDPEPSPSDTGDDFTPVPFESETDDDDDGGNNGNANANGRRDR